MVWLVTLTITLKRVGIHCIVHCIQSKGLNSPYAAIETMFLDDSPEAVQVKTPEKVVPLVVIIGKLIST